MTWTVSWPVANQAIINASPLRILPAISMGFEFISMTRDPLVYRSDGSKYFADLLAAAVER